MRLKLVFIVIVAFLSLVGFTTYLGWDEAAAQSPSPTPTTSEGKQASKEIMPAVSGANHPRLSRVELSLSSAEIPVTDNFGYTRDDAAIYAWLESASWIQAGFSHSADDDFVGPIDLGFNFKFYENTYPQIYISTNGVLTFGDGGTYPRNEYIPQNTVPNNLIAPFWDDLAVGGTFNSGEVHYATEGSAPNRYFIVKWEGVGRRYGGGVLTFQVILKENGDIKFQYKTLDGQLDQATVGIEDADGVDGLLYTYNNSSTLTANKAIEYLRPSPGPRVKILSLYQGGFTQDGQSIFTVGIRNTGESGVDTFDLIPVSSSAGWEVSLLAENAITPLTDSNGNGAIDTGPINPGMTRAVKVTLNAPTSASRGNFTDVTLTVRSSIDSGKQAQTNLFAAIPAPFGQALADSQEGIRLNLTSSSHLISPKVRDWFSGSTLAINQTYQGGYIYAWEKNDSKLVNNMLLLYSDIEYALVGNHGEIIKLSDKLTNNYSGIDSVNDRSPVVAATPDGKIAVVWVRSIIDQGKTNSNVLIYILKADGSLAFYEPINITANSQYRGEGDLDIPLFISPRVSATGDNNFVISWVDQRLKIDGEVSDVYHTVINSAGETIKPVTKLTQGIPGGTRYFDPTLESLGSNNVFVGYAVSNPEDDGSSIGYKILGSNGAIVETEKIIPLSNGWTPDVVQLGSGKILVAWTNANNNKISFALISNTNFSVVSGPKDLTNPNLRQSDFVSVTKDDEGNGILTWMDSMWNHHLYYALVNDDGGLITPPMVFLTGQSSEPLVLTSYAGQGNAFYKGVWETFVPIVTR